MKINGYNHHTSKSMQAGTDPFQDPFFNRLAYFKEQLQNKQALMEYLSILCSKAIRKIGWKLEDFELNNLYAIEFMGGDMEQLMRSYDIQYSLVYQCVSPEHILCVCANAAMNEEEEIEVYTEVFELPDYQKGNREWLELLTCEDGKLSGEVVSAGPDVFSLEYLLRNNELEWVAAQEEGIEAE